MTDDVLDRPFSLSGETAGQATAFEDSTRSSRGPLAMRITGALPSVDALELVVCIARSLGQDLLLVRTLGTLPDGTNCIDPVDWDIGRGRLLAELRRSADRLRRPDCAVEACVVDRFVLAQFAPDAGAAPPAIGFLREPGELPWHRDADARQLVENGVSVLIVPTHPSIERGAGPSRVLVPLDGSVRAERAIERALIVARCALSDGRQACVVLAHVAPEPVLTRIGPPDGQTDAMVTDLLERNRRVATNYLRALARRYADKSVRIESHLLDGNVPRCLLNTIASDRIDLIVMASDGAGAHGDVAPGSVATHLAAHAPVPVLLIGFGENDEAIARADTPGAPPIDSLRHVFPPAGHG